MNRKRLKTAEKLAAGIITAAMSLSFVPGMLGNGKILAAEAKNTGNTWLGTSGIDNPDVPGSSDSDWSGSYVYFGEYGGSPIRFRVLEKNSTAYTSDKSLFLDSDEILFSGSYDGSSPISNVWINSDIRGVLNGSFLSGAFTALEKGAIASSTGKGKITYSSGSFEEYAYGSPVGISDKVFLLDAGDVTNESYGYSSDCGWTTSSSWSTGTKKSHDVASRAKSGAGSVWVLRSTTNGNSEYVGGVSASGNLNSYYAGAGACGIAPALNVNQKSIIFSSLTGNGENEYKLTLLDKNLAVAVTANSNVIAEGNKITVPYSISGSDSGKVTRISVLILDKEYKAGNAENTGIVFYDSLNGEIDSTGTGTFTLPSSLDISEWGSGYHVYILAEDINGGKETDYASSPVKLSVPEIKAEPTPTAKPTSAPKSTWVQEGGKWYYYDANSKKATGWIKDGKSWYYCDKNGVMQTGWIQDGKTWYYLNASGAMSANCWVKSGNAWYYIGSSGAMATNCWVKSGNAWYYISASGVMVTNGWVQSGGKWYYMNASGAMVTNGWVQSGKTWYYFDANGVMVTGELVIDGKKSKFSSTGAWLGYV